MKSLIHLAILVGFLFGQVLGMGAAPGFAGGQACGCVAVHAGATQAMGSCCDLAALARGGGDRGRSCVGERGGDCGCGGACGTDCLCGCREAPDQLPATAVVETLRLIAVPGSGSAQPVRRDAIEVVVPARGALLVPSLLGRAGLNAQAFLGIWRT